MEPINEIEIEEKYHDLLINTGANFIEDWVTFIQNIACKADMDKMPETIKKFSKDLIEFTKDFTDDDFKKFHESILNRKDWDPIKNDYDNKIGEVYINIEILTIYDIAKKFGCPQSVALFQLIRAGKIIEKDDYFQMNDRIKSIGNYCNIEDIKPGLRVKCLNTNKIGVIVSHKYQELKNHSPNKGFFLIIEWEDSAVKRSIIPLDVNNPNDVDWFYQLKLVRV